MKRSEIVTGAVLYYSDRRDWEDWPSSGEPVTVVDAENRYKKIRPRRTADGFTSYQKLLGDEKGQGVLVERANGQPFRFVVQPQYLHGDYATEVARLAELATARDADQRESRLRDEAAQRMRKQLAGQTNIYVGERVATPVFGSRWHEDKIAVDPEFLLAALNELMARGWTYDTDMYRRMIQNRLDDARDEILIERNQAE